MTAAESFAHDPTWEGPGTTRVPYGVYWSPEIHGEQLKFGRKLCIFDSELFPGWIIYPI